MSTEVLSDGARARRPRLRRERVRFRSCDGAQLLAAFAAAAGHVVAHAEELNALNIFPVPDGDTGANLSATVRAALDEAEALPLEERSPERVAAAIGLGALMGARGNSGVILSQIFRGMASGLEGKRRIDGRDLARALARGNETAYAAVVKPVEGTILTVVREVAVAAGEVAERTAELDAVLGAAVAAAERAVASTPSLLAVLRDAGVVDAGGQGLFRLLEGARRAGTGGAAAPLPAAVEGPPPMPAGDDDGATYGYETMFLVSARDQPLDLAANRAELENLGDSVLVAGDERAVKVHVHNDRPDAVIALGLRLGAPSRISVENLDQQAAVLREARASAFAGGATAGEAPAVRATTDATGAVAPATPRVGVVAVAAGEGLTRAFASFGSQVVVAGGQGANPSTGELVRAVRTAASPEILLLTNNPNLRLAAQQAASLAPEKRVVVVPTRNSAEGLAAMLAFDPGRTADANAGPMLDAARAVRTFVVTQAVRDGRIGGRRVKRGQAIALDADEALLAVAHDPERAVIEAVAQLEPGFELLTLYWGDGGDEAAVERLVQALDEACPGADVHVVPGGQPNYRYLVAAE